MSLLLQNEQRLPSVNELETTPQKRPASPQSPNPAGRRKFRDNEKVVLISTEIYRIARYFPERGGYRVAVDGRARLREFVEESRLVKLREESPTSGEEHLITEETSGRKRFEEGEKVRVASLTVYRIVKYLPEKGSYRIAVDGRAKFREFVEESRLLKLPEDRSSSPDSPDYRRHPPKRAKIIPSTTNQQSTIDSRSLDVASPAAFRIAAAEQKIRDMEDQHERLLLELETQRAEKTEAMKYLANVQEQLVSLRVQESAMKERLDRTSQENTQLRQVNQQLRETIDCYNRHELNDAPNYR